MDISFLSPEFYIEVAFLASLFDRRTRNRFVDLCIGCLFAKNRKTVASWLRAARVGNTWRTHYYFLSTIGRKSKRLARALLSSIGQKIELGERLVFVIDDSPTERFGPLVEGAGKHRNPTPGPANQKFLYGHIWVSISLVAYHSQWGAIGLPLLALLYVRQKDMPILATLYRWKFKTKLELAAELVEWAAFFVESTGKEFWVVADGFYAKRPFLKRAMAAGATVVSRLRKDAALYAPPKPSPKGKRGRKRKYGKRISLATRAGHPDGWQTGEFLLYGKRVTKTFKTFVALYKPVGGLIRVVLVKEEHGWAAFFCTNPDATVADILGLVADRAVIEQNYHDLKEVEGIGQQQVRNVWSSVGAINLAIWNFTLIELWAWDKKYEEICDRSGSPWDTQERRPSHADRRKALQREYFQEQFSRLPAAWRRKRKIRALFSDLLSLAA